MPALINGLGGVAGFGEQSLASNDDQSSAFISLASIFPSGFEFFGQIYTGIYINNNGSITFTDRLVTFTPTAITADTSMPIIAPFWADVDTRGTGGNVSPGGTSTGSNAVYWDIDPELGRVVITWDDVGYYNNQTDKVNAFQLVIVATGNGDFSFEFRYENVDWTAGDESGGTGGLGGTGARAGYSAGDGINFFELPQSGNEPALLDLEATSNVGDPGIWRFNVTDGYPGIAVKVSDAEVVEGQSGDRHELVFVVTLNKASDEVVRVDFATQDGTATGGAGVPFDYVARSGTLEFAPGETSKTIVIEVIGDYRNEASETLKLLLSNPDNLFLADPEGSGLIKEDDGLVVTGMPAIEPRSDGTTKASFDIKLLSASNEVVEVTYRTMGGTASDGSDYIGAVGTLVFQPGETWKTVTVDILGDSLIEGDETITLVISDPVNAGILTDRATIKIYDEDNDNPVPPEAPATQSVLDPQYAALPDPEPEPVVEQQSYTTPRYRFDEQTENWSIPGAVETVQELGNDALGFFRAARKEIVDAFQKTLIENYVQPKYRAMVDLFREFPEKKQFIENFYDKITAEMSNALDAVKNGASEEEMDAIWRRLEQHVEEARKKGEDDLGKDLTGEALQAIRAKTSHSDVSLNVDVDFRPEKAEIRSEAGHHDIFMGSAGADTVYLGDKNDFAWASEGDDTIYGEEGDDLLSGSIGNDKIFGGSGADLLDGGAGDDLLDGGSGIDKMRGGDGDDTYIVDHTSDLAIETGAAGGIDAVESSASFALGAHLENLTLTGVGEIEGTGNAGDNILRGNNAANVLRGGGGNDTLNGRGGADWMRGGNGDDVYYVDNAGDNVVEESATGGFDKVNSTVSFGLGAFVEHLTLGGSAAIDGTGNELANVLEGNSGANVLDGRSGSDKMFGRGGDDTYFVDNLSDRITEEAGEGIDSVRSTVSLVLGANVENLTLLGIAAINGTGNSLANVLIGNSAANELAGGAGADLLNGGGGGDIMRGGSGNDIYYVDHAKDIAIEDAANGGTDTVKSSVTYGLGTQLEVLSLTGNAAINGYGNEQNNWLYGNGAANLLNGNGGADLMSGAGGDDTYIVDHIKDRTIETSANGGVDTVKSSVTYALSKNVEVLSLTGSISINGYGNDQNNWLYGNAAANLLNGNGGADIMRGGGGNDTYIVDNVQDQAIEDGANGGIDTVKSSVSFVLGAGLEVLSLTGGAAINGYGNDQVNWLYGNSAANLLNGNGGADSMSGGGGDDTYIVDHAKDRTIEASGNGWDTVNSSVSYAVSQNIEVLSLTGTAAINGYGNDQNNWLYGNAAANLLNGNGGADVMRGGGGNDTYIVDHAKDQVIEDSAGGSSDAVKSTVSYALGTHVEVLSLTGTAAINGYGNDQNNWLYGNGAANLLSGNGGADVMRGGGGDDTYVVDHAKDQVIEDSASGGSDTVKSSVSYALGAHVEVLSLTGIAAINGYGNELNNWLYGNAAANLLNGNGGADVMRGGGGDDIYIVDHAKDQVIEDSASGGSDTVKSSVSYALGAHVEVLSLTGTAAINGYGNDQNNWLYGNGAANLLSGNGGADVMRGGGGDDTYIVDNAKDLAIEEAANGGRDTVKSSVSYALGAHVEILSLTGTTAINGYGNELNNWLYGNSAANVLNGGAGADQMRGGAGSDTYFVDHAGDSVVELAGGGDHDLIRASVSFTLGDHVEVLGLTGAAAINGTGNALSNGLYGNSANNTLTGLAGHDRLDGGGGADLLIGGTGDDVYVIDQSGDRIVEHAGEGEDEVRSAITFTLAPELEHLTLTGTAAISGSGNASANRIIGNSGANTLWGYSGNDYIDGGAGGDAMYGGVGDDTYVVDSALDRVSESTDAGVDRVNSSVNFALGANIEHLVLIGTGSISGIGNSLNNTVQGNSGSNRIDGGLGGDIMSGGAGDDVYVVESTGDIVVELDGEGRDTVLSTISWSLGHAQEDLQLLGNTATNGLGNDLANSITGNDLANTLAGFGGDDTLIGGGGADRLQGGSGNDTYFIDSLDQLFEAAEDGIDTVHSVANHTLGAHFENLVLTGTALSGTGNELNNSLAGNHLANTLSGGAGDDTLDGKGGTDRLMGGLGDDVYYIGPEGDTVEEGVNAGTDTVYSASHSYTLTANVERLWMLEGIVIPAGMSQSYANGNTLNNQIIGNSQANIIDGGAGSDSMEGGAGDDFYVVDNALDAVFEDPDRGYDFVQSSVSYSLSDWVEGLQLAGSAYSGQGNNLDNTLIGTSGANYLFGGEGNDFLNGFGGNDKLEGGIGDDTYRLWQGSTYEIIEYYDGGSDTVEAAWNMSLSAFENVENITLLGSATTAYGNSSDNVLRGNDQNNELNGLEGADTLIGGLGNDLYYVDHYGDQAIEEASEGLDSVQASVSFELGANVENLFLYAEGTGFGNELDNRIIGSYGAQVLYGREGNDYIDGSYDADRMFGGSGDDRYRVDNAGDTVTEYSGQGTDWVDVAEGTSFTLSDHVENAQIVQGGGYVAGGSAITGNSLANVLIGGRGSETLVGGAGNDEIWTGHGGSDVVEGGAGQDSFYTHGSNWVRVLDFNAADDTFFLDMSRFEGMPEGTLDANAFAIFPSSLDADDRVYLRSDGWLFFDPDGSGDTPGFAFAHLNNMPQDLTYADFVFFSST